MHTDLIEKSIARRLRGASDQPGEAPYDWAEFQRRRGRSMLTRAIERNRPAAIAAAVVATLLVTAIPYLRSTHSPAPRLIPPNTMVDDDVSDRQERARTRAIEGWLARLPHDRVIVRVGTHAAVSSLQDQIAALDDLMSTERAAGAQPVRL
ncbi:MAG: hypothetical protein ACRETR_02340, partial [Steroidobacteraceae bacterium]